MATAERSGPHLAPYYLILFGLTAGLGGVVVLLAELKNELGFSNFGVGLAISSGFASAFVASLIMAPQADRGKSPMMLRTALIVGGLSMVVLAVGDQLWHYVVGRSLYGFALGTGGPAVRRTVIVADPENLGRNLGRLGAFDVAGFMVAPLIVTAITHYAGFRASFWASAAFLFLLLPVAFKAQTDTAPQDTERLGLSGLLRIRRLVGALVLAAAYFVFIGAFESVWILEMDFRGADQTTIGIALTLAALPMPLLSPIGGVLAQRYGARRWAVGTMFCMVIIVFFYGLVPGVWWLVAVTTITSAIEGFGFPTIPMLASAAVPQERQAAAQGLLGAVEVAAGAISSLTIAFIYGISSDTLAWTVTGITMAVLLTIGTVLTQPEDHQRVRPGVPSELLRRPFE